MKKQFENKVEMNNKLQYKYKKLKKDYGKVVIIRGKKNKIVKIQQDKLQYNIKKLTREVNNKILVVNQYKERYKSIV